MAEFQEGQRVRVAGLVAARISDGERVPITGTVRLVAASDRLALVTLDEAFGGHVVTLPLGRLEALGDAGEALGKGAASFEAAVTARLTFIRWLVQTGHLGG